MTENCLTTEYKYNPKTKKCVLSDSYIGNHNVKITANDDIKYKDTMYLYKTKREHCNNYTERWQDWFCIKYYYLNNYYEQGSKISEDELTDTISECFKPCENDYIAVNKSDKCESLTTFKNKKYEGFLKYDPFAIICIIASKITEGNNVWNDSTKGNHCDVLHNIASSTEENKFIWLTESKDLYTDDDDRIGKDKNRAKGISQNIYNGEIIHDIDKAYGDIEKYIKKIRSENEEDQDKIKNNIKTDIYKFFVLFDKRDEFYIEYLEHIKIKTMQEYFSSIQNNLDKKRGGKGGGGGMEYAYNLAQKYGTLAAVDTVKTGDDSDKEIKHVSTDKYIDYLFYHACDICFSDTSIFRDRVKKFLSIDITDNPDIKFLDYENKLFSAKQISDNDKLIYKPLIPVKIDKENIAIFGEYTEAFNYYKNIINLFPIILLIIIAISVIYVLLIKLKILKGILHGVNLILNVALLLLLFIMKLVVNSGTIGVLTYVIIQPAIFLYGKMLIIMSIIIFSLILLPIRPQIFKFVSTILLSLLTIISMFLRFLLENNIFLVFTVFVTYTFYTIMMKGDDVMDIIINADTSFLNIVDLKYKVYKYNLLYSLYENTDFN